MDRYQPLGGGHFRPVADAAICPALRSATAARPAFLHFSMPIRTACGVTVCP